MNKHGNIVRKVSKVAIPLVLSRLHCDRLPTVPSVNSSTAKVERVEKREDGYEVTVTYWVDGSGPSGTIIQLNEDFTEREKWKYSTLIWVYKSRKSVWD